MLGLAFLFVFFIYLLFSIGVVVYAGIKGESKGQSKAIKGVSVD